MKLIQAPLLVLRWILVVLAVLTWLVVVPLAELVLAGIERLRAHWMPIRR